MSNGRFDVALDPFASWSFPRAIWFSSLSSRKPNQNYNILTCAYLNYLTSRLIQIGLLKRENLAEFRVYSVSALLLHRIFNLLENCAPFDQSDFRIDLLESHVSVNPAF